jgi:hypothetical protein
MPVNSLDDEFVERSPVLGFEVVAVHGCGGIERRAADPRFLLSNIRDVVDVVFCPACLQVEVDIAGLEKISHRHS